MKKCVVCESVISRDNDSYEHIIPNAIGGRLKIKGFLCKNCNSACGTSWDLELARQLNYLCLFLGIARDRGESPPQTVETTAGEKFSLLPGGGLALLQPTYSETPTDSGTQIRIVARDRREARKILRGVSKKYPGIDVNEIAENAVAAQSYPEGMVRFSVLFGGDVVAKSIVKTALSFCAFCRLPEDSFSAALNFMLGKSDGSCFGYFYDRDIVRKRPGEIPFHCVALCGNSEDGALLAYIEYFSIYRIIVILSRQYDGPDVHEYYAVNPLSGERIDLDISLDVSLEEIGDVRARKDIPAKILESLCSPVLANALQRQHEVARNRLITDAIHDALSRLGVKPGDVLTADHLAAISQLVAERMTPFMLRALGAKT